MVDHVNSDHIEDWIVLANKASRTAKAKYRVVNSEEQWTCCVKVIMLNNQYGHDYILKSSHEEFISYKTLHAQHNAPNIKKANPHYRFFLSIISKIYIILQAYLSQQILESHFCFMLF